MAGIHIHTYYEDLLSIIIKRLIKIPIKYDFYISTISKDKKIILKSVYKNQMLINMK